MKQLSKKHTQTLLASGIALLHLIVTFFTDKCIFIFGETSNKSDYIICKFIAYIVLFFFYKVLLTVIFSKEKNELLIVQILKKAAPFALLTLAILVIKLRGGFISNDESVIFDAAKNLEHYTWFYYLTTYYYIVSLMLVPFTYGPVVIKAVIQVLVTGYTVVRAQTVFGKKAGSLSYVLFLLYPVIAYTASAHRLPVYYLLYLVLIETLLFDYLEKKPLGNQKAFWLLLLCAILTQWRTEGIYLAALIPILMFFVYPALRNKKNAFIYILGLLLIQYVISVPQNGLLARGLDSAANDRMKPFYAYTITNMYRNGLDLEKNSEDLAIVDRYLSIEAIAAINDYYEDINYEDVLILYQPGFVGTREEADTQDFINYSDALKRIFKNNPGVFLKTRWGAFHYAATPFAITYHGFSPRALAAFGLSIVKSVLYNLYLPLTFILLLCLYALIRKRWFTFFLSGGVLAHWFIVFILAPASYFKYYFPVYITAYFYLLLLVITFTYNKINQSDISVIL